MRRGHRARDRQRAEEPFAGAILAFYFAGHAATRGPVVKRRVFAERRLGRLQFDTRGFAGRAGDHERSEGEARAAPPRTEFRGTGCGSLVLKRMPWCGTVMR